MTLANPSVSPADIPALLSHFDLGAVLACQRLGGTTHTTYMVETTRRTVALRVYTPGHSSLEHIQLELRVLQHLARANFESPRLLAGNDGQLLQRWNGLWLCASDFIPGVPADQVLLSPELVGDVGRLIATFQNAIASFALETLPAHDAFLERSETARQSLGAVLRSKQPNVDVDKIVEQWGAANAALALHEPVLRTSVLHADLWPPNILCIGNRVTGLLDFDACCLGPTFADVALALMEFSMFRRDQMDEDLATAFLAGFFRNGGRLTALEQSLLLNAMEVACASWWAWEVIEEPPFGEGEYYQRRLELWGAAESRNSFVLNLDRMVARARPVSL